MKVNRYKSYKTDSKWEEKLKNGVLKKYEYHPVALDYTIPSTKHKYHPDWCVRHGDKTIYIEAKGRFRERAEYMKYLYVREALKASEELVFLFMKPLTPMPNAQRRLDGSRRTHAEWAETNGFEWYTEETIHKLLKG